jgi:hypothetical protein
VTRTRSLLLCILTFGCLAVSVASAQAACTKTWKGGNGNWGTASDWSPEVVPGSSDSVCIAAPATVTLPANGGVAKTLTVGGGSGEVTIDVAGESYDNAGNTSNETDLDVVEAASFAANTKLVLESTNATTEAKVEPHGAGGGLVGGSVVEAGQIEAVNNGAPWANRIKLANLQIEPGASLLDASGTLLFVKEGEGAYPWTVTNEGTFTVAAGASVEMQPSFAGKAEFINDATVVNDGSITTHGAEWTQQAGSVSGNEVMLQGGSTLLDAAGTGKFLDNYGTLTLTGTIPTGQTVTVRGEPFSSGGETSYSTTLSGGGKELVNDGTLVLNPTGSGEVSGGGVNVEAGSIHNNGLIDDQTETAARVTQLLDSLTNGPAGRLEVNGGIFQGNNGSVTTNEGLVTIAPGAVYQLQEAASFVNDGTLSPQIASVTSIGAVQLAGPCCSGPGKFTAGGTLAPALIGGFVPTAGQEFDLFELDGGKFEGTFAALAGGFTADYAHETSQPAFVGAVYGVSAAGGPGGGSAPKPPVVRIGSISRKQGKPTVTLSCPAGGATCQAVSVQVTVTEHLKGGRVIAVTARKGKKKVAVKKKQVVIATGSAALAAGTSKTLELALNGPGRALLAKFGKLTAIVTVSSGGQTISTATVHLQKAPKRKKK